MGRCGGGMAGGTAVGPSGEERLGAKRVMREEGGGPAVVSGMGLALGGTPCCIGAKRIAMPAWAAVAPGSIM